MASAVKTHYNKLQKIWHGNKSHPPYGENDSLGLVIYRVLKDNADHIAQVSYSSGQQLTNQEILLSAIRIAQNLECLKIEQGEIVGICASNTDYIASLVFGCLFRGIVISTLDPSFDKGGIKHIYSITKPKLMFCNGSIYEKVKEAFEECGLSSIVIYTVKDHIEGVPKLDDLLCETKREKEFKCVDLKMGSGQLAAVLCSSGTTGLPKGVCLSHIGLLNALGVMHKMFERFLCFSTLYWISGLLTLLIGTVHKFTRIISENAFTPKDFIEIAEKLKPTLFLGPPSQIGLLLAHPELNKNTLSSFKWILLGGSATPYKLVEKLQKYTPEANIIIGYGQTETCGGIAIGPAIEDGNVGQLVSNVEMKIINDENKSLGPGEVGEICSRTLYHWLGYYNNSKSTKEVYDTEKWIHSGDLGYFNERGDLYVIDRKKDILKYNNYHFYPTEIEAVILQIPDVVEVCVFGVPDIIFSHLPAAAIVKRPESTLTGEKIYQHIAEKMSHFKQLRGGVYFVSSLPKTASGKILRRKVAELCQNINSEVIV